MRQVKKSPCRIFYKQSRHERETSIKRRMPVFIVMPAVAYPQLAVYSGFPHCLKKLNVSVEQKIIVTAIHKPCNSSETVLTQVVSLLDISGTAVFDDRTCQYTHFVSQRNVRHVVCRNRHQCTHCIYAAEHIAVPLSVAGCTASAHRQTCNCAFALTSAGTIKFLNMRNKLLKEETLIFPSRHIEIAILYHMRIASSGIRRNDDHFISFATGNQTIHYLRNMSSIDPHSIVFPHTVEQIKYWIMLRFINIETARKHHSVSSRRIENLAVYGIGNNFTTSVLGLHLYGTHQNKCNGNCHLFRQEPESIKKTFHIIY